MDAFGATVLDVGPLGITPVVAIDAGPVNPDAIADAPAWGVVRAEDLPPADDDGPRHSE